MKKTFGLTAVFVLFAAVAFAHGGHAHKYSGTVTMVHGSDEFMIKTTDNKDVTVKTTSKTKYLHSDNHAAKRSELGAGTRVVVTMSTDGKTAATVKMSAAKK